MCLVNSKHYNWVFFLLAGTTKVSKTEVKTTQKIQTATQEVKGEPEILVDEPNLVTQPICLDSHLVSEVQGEQKEGGKPPVFVRKLDHKCIPEGQPAHLEVKVTGNPEVNWFMDGEPLQDELIYDFISTSDGTHILIIKETFPEDEGEYLCEATNPHGMAETNCLLTITGV